MRRELKGLNTEEKPVTQETAPPGAMGVSLRSQKPSTEKAPRLRTGPSPRTGFRVIPQLKDFPWSR